MIKFEVNGEKVELKIPSETPLLWVVREELGLLGSKFGCGQGLCGACTMLVDGEATRTCILEVGDVAGSKITTIEGLPAGDAVQKAWSEIGVPQCGYCQSGQIMQATSLLRQAKPPSREEISESMSGNICRCGTYNKIVEAIELASNRISQESRK